jgi:NTE family protein
MTQKKMIHLALQGGGAHGAFTWGILDELLEDGRIDFDGICATSAGSMNAVVLTHGKMIGGNDGARKALHQFWLSISKISNIFGSVKSENFDKISRHVSHSIFETFTHLISPYQFNPFNYNILRDVIESQVDFEKLKNYKSSNLFISTTNVRTGKARVFNNSELSLDVVMASTCLPYLFQAVEINGEHYWDGGYMGNPAIFPLFYHKNTTDDVMIIHINPIVRNELPTSASKIMNRINEITFNSSLIAELRAVAFVNKLKSQEWLKDEYSDKLKHIFVHAIRADEVLIDHGITSKFDTSWKFLLHLKNLGKIEAKNWLKQNFSKLGKESTVDLYKEFLTSDNEIV